MKEKSIARWYVFIMIAYSIVFFIFVFLGVQESQILLKIVFFVVAGIQATGGIIYYYLYAKRKARGLPKHDELQQ